MKQDSAAGYLAEIGVLTREWGIRGEMLLRLFDINVEELEYVDELLISTDPKKWRTIESVRQHKGQALIKIEGIENPEDARKFRGATVSAYLSEEPVLPEGIYLFSQIIGLDVKDEQGVCLGSVKEIIKTGSNDVYVVTEGGHELLVPAIKDVVKQIDLDKGIIVVSMPEIAE
ncbi:MAG: 16S rRNA processing protein RimM [Nitrospirae bacterium]|nr:16S rRNA processing protein RimM [Nitrospirota bacterium]